MRPSPTHAFVMVFGVTHTFALLFAFAPVLALVLACDPEPDYQGPNLCPDSMDAAVCYEAILACSAYETAFDECHYRYSFEEDGLEATTNPYDRCMYFMGETPDLLPWTWCWSLETTCEERMDAIENGTSNDPVCGHLRPGKGDQV